MNLIIPHTELVDKKSKSKPRVGQTNSANQLQSIRLHIRLGNTKWWQQLRLSGPWWSKFSINWFSFMHIICNIFLPHSIGLHWNWQIGLVFKFAFAFLWIIGNSLKVFWKLTSDLIGKVGDKLPTCCQQFYCYGELAKSMLVSEIFSPW